VECNVLTAEGFKNLICFAFFLFLLGATIETGYGSSGPDLTGPLAASF